MHNYLYIDKKLKYPGAADIPIVRLNPFGILDIKKEGMYICFHDYIHRYVYIDIDR